MVWKKRKKQKKKKTNYSFSKQLRDNGLSNERFEIMLNNLHLEDIVALKLELACRSSSYHLYGTPIWGSVNKIVKESIFKFAMSSCATTGEVCSFLGIAPVTFYGLKKKYIKEEEINNG